MEQWKALILATFGKKARKTWIQVVIDICLVDIGAKPTFLFDYWALTAEKAISFLSELLCQGLVQHQMQVVRVGLDVFIYSPSSLLQLHTSCPHFMNVSSSLDHPCLIDETIVQETKTAYSQFLNEYASISDGAQSSPDQFYNIDVSCGLNPPCLFGLLLGYPCVYWYDRKVGEENCLSSEPLKLFCVRGTLTLCQGKHCESCEQIIPYVSDSKRTCKSTQRDVFTLHTPCLSTDRTCCEYQDRETVEIEVSNKGSWGQTHTIFSFTVPVIVLQTVHDDVHAWFAQWKKGHSQLRDIFSHVWMEEVSIEPQAVCL